MQSNKYWGKVDKAALASLVEDGDINISDTSLEYTASIHSDYFSHHDLRNFRRNSRFFLAAFDPEAEYAGARQRNGGNCTSLFVVIFMRVRVPLIPSLPPAAARRQIINVEDFEEGSTDAADVRAPPPPTAARTTS